jgi:hypothetical protein
MTFNSPSFARRNSNRSAPACLEQTVRHNAGLADATVRVRDIVPGLGLVEWTQAERLAHAEAIRIGHGPNRALARARRTAPFRARGKGNCRTCGEAWICSHAIWSAAVRALAAMTAMKQRART